MKDRLRVIAASGEVGEDARIFHTKSRAMNAESKGRDVQGHAMTPLRLFDLFQEIDPCEILGGFFVE